jgi:hypothetical protein
LLLPALIGWSASHLARIGEPYASIARIATEVTDRRVQSLLQAGAASDATQGDVSLEDKLWIVLMLGGIEVSNLIAKRASAGVLTLVLLSHRSAREASTDGKSFSRKSEI